MTGPEDDFTKPSMRRVYDYWLGGRDNFAADREQAHRIEAAYPPLPAGQVPVPRRNVRAGRAFLERAVAWTAQQGVAQFAQLAAGPPAPPQYPPLHEVARREKPGTRWAYTDADPVTASIIRAFTAGQDVAVIEGDAREPDAILKLLGEAVDLDMPTGVILAMGLQMLPLEQARELAAAYVAALVPRVIPRAHLPDVHGPGTVGASLLGPHGRQGMPGLEPLAGRHRGVLRGDGTRPR